MARQLPISVITTKTMFALEKVVPWGRTYDEYCRMFALDERDLASSILGCGDGPASFNAEAATRGVRVVSCDPLYRFTTDAIKARIDETSGEVIRQTRANAHEFVWTSIPSIDALIRLRQWAMTRFLADYEEGRAVGRYVDAELPALPFQDAGFDLALCSHLLFLYSEQLDEAFHVRAARELCRVAREVRIFPLLALGGVPSPHLASVTRALRHDGFSVTVETVPYEFVRGGNRMLRIARSTTSHVTTA